METMSLEMTRIFIKVIQFGGFSKAAQALGVPKSSVSKTISKLETLTGTKLLMRSTRSHTLTEAGRLFYEACLGPLQQLEEAQKSLFASDSLLSGKIKITAPEDLGSYVIAPTLARLTTQYPNLSFELYFTNQIVDLIKEGFDLAIRIGKLSESRIKVRRLGHLNMILVASPKYLNSAGMVRSPGDLNKMHCLAQRGSPLYRKWHLRSSKGSAVIEVSSRFESNHMTSLLEAAIAGAGILLCPSYLAQNYLQRKELVRILPDWYASDLPVSILSPVGITSTQRLRVVFVELEKALQLSL